MILCRIMIYQENNKNRPSPLQQPRMIRNLASQFPDGLLLFGNPALWRIQCEGVFLRMKNSDLKIKTGAAIDLNFVLI